MGFAATFQTAMQEVAAASDDSALSAALTALIDTIEVTGVATDKNQVIVPEQQVVLAPPVTKIIEVLTGIIETLANATWYPDWGTSQSHKCLNGGNAPFYMTYSGLYFEKSRASCCKRFFDWDFYTCAGNSLDISIGFYPNWDSNEVKCINATDSMPDYVRKNPAALLFDTIESCCDRHYSWDQLSCVSNSGGSILSSFTGKFYVNHVKQMCQQDCPDGEGEGRCGGPVDSWSTLYDTAKECCEKKLSWIALTTCEAQSSLGDGNALPSFTGNYYVNSMKEICQQDCPDGEGGGRCGGPVDSWKTLYDTIKKCCEANLNWIAPSTCEAQSTLSASTRSSDWYVDWDREKCVKNCIDSSDVNCGGLVEGVWDELYTTAANCCARLDWIDPSECTA